MGTADRATEAPSSGSGSPCRVLKDEHRVIERVLRVLERLVEGHREGKGFEESALRRCVEFFQLFADACHHTKEEHLLFPVLEARGIPREGGPIGVMLEEHRLGRAYIREMSDELGAAERDRAEAAERFCRVADRYLELLENHIFKEENVLFEMGDRVMSDADRTELSDRLCSVACPALRGKTHQDLELMADELEAEWGSG